MPAAISGVGNQNASPFASSEASPIVPRNSTRDESGLGGFEGGHNRGSFNETSSGSANWYNALTDAFRFGMRSSRFSGSGGGHPPNLDSLFQMGSKFSEDAGKELGSGKSGSPAGVLPDLSQVERNGLKLPVNSSAGKFQFSYRDRLGPGGNAMGGGIGRGSAQATFNSTGLKDDMLHFSATAMFGGAGSGMGSSFTGSGAGGSSFGSGGAFGTGGQGNGMFSVGNMNGAGIGSGSGGFSAGSMHGDMGGDERDGAGGMHGMGGEGGRGHGAESGPSVSLKLTFK